MVSKTETSWNWVKIHEFVSTSMYITLAKKSYGELWSPQGIRVTYIFTVLFCAMSLWDSPRPLFSALHPTSWSHLPVSIIARLTFQSLTSVKLPPFSSTSVSKSKVYMILDMRHTMCTAFFILLTEYSIWDHCGPTRAFVTRTLMENYAHAFMEHKGLNIKLP